MNPKVILLNAPKMTGKDHAADYVVDRIDTCPFADDEDIAFKMMFKDPLYTITAAIYTVPREELIKDATNRATKEVPMDKYFGRSPRQALIHTSEEAIKPMFGQAFFGDASVKIIDKIVQNFEVDGKEKPFFIFSDSGFVEEALPVIKCVGAENVVVFRIFRDGHTFNGDSRRYLSQDDFNQSIQFVDIVNNGTLAQFEEAVYNQVLKFIKNP